MDFTRIELHAKECILVVLSNTASVRDPEPAEKKWRSDWCRGAHLVYSNPGKMVANSKSIRQNRPSDCR